MTLSTLNALELTNLALSVATVLTDGLSTAETEALIRLLCLIRDDVSLILCEKRQP